MQGLEVQVAGAVAVVADGMARALRPSQRQLLALLVAAGPGGATPDRLADELWGEELPANWPNSLRVAISRLRRQSGLDVAAGGGRYTLAVDTSTVDAWRLLDLVDRVTRADRPGSDQPSADGPGSDQPIADQAVIDALAGGPDLFAGVPGSPLLTQTSTSLAAAQRLLIERLAVSDIRPDRRTLNRLAAHVTADPFDEALVAAVATIHHRVGATAAALGLLELCRQERQRAFGVGLSEGLARLGEAMRARESAVEPELPPRPRQAMPGPLDRFRSRLLVGRDSVRDHLDRLLLGPEVPVVVVRAPAGYGKTALLADLVGRLLEGPDDRDGPDRSPPEDCPYVIHLGGIRLNTIGLAPLTQAVPGFAAAVIETAEAGLDQGNRLLALADRLSSLIRVQSGGHSVLLVVDDAQWLDSQTCELLDYLVRTELDSGLLFGLLMASRNADTPSSPWLRLEESLGRRAHLVELRLGPLEVSDLETLVAEVQPELALVARHQKASRLHRASGGVPEAAHRLLDMEPRSAPVDGGSSVRDGTGRPPTPADQGEPGGGSPRVFDLVVESTGGLVREVAVAAAVMGRRFRLSDLSLLLDRPAEDLFDAVDELIERELIAETDSFDRFDFAHDLILDAFLRLTPNPRRARLHLQAAGLVGGDVHDLARHRLAAGSLCDEDLTRDTILQSAEAHLADGAYWESATAYRAAVELTGGEVPLASLVAYARALALSGDVATARSVRAQTFERAARSGRWDQAVAAAVSGLPEAESPNGEIDRFDQLEAVPTAELEPETALQQAMTLARQATLLGRHEDAARWVIEAERASRTVSERAEAALARWFAESYDTPPGVRLERLDRVVESADLQPPVWCRVLQARAIDHLQTGALASAEAEHRSFQRLASELDDQLRIWHGLVFDALLNEVQGRLIEADTQVQAAEAHGRRAGITSSGIVRVAQNCFRFELQGRLGQLAEFVDRVPVPDADTEIFNAAVVRVLIAAGRYRDANELARRVALDLAGGGGLRRAAVQALLAPTLARSAPVDLRRRTMEGLEPFRAGSLVIGAGVGLVPSVEAMWILLDRGYDDGIEPSLTQAIGFADRVGLLSYSVRHRLDLAQVTGSERLVVEAADLARSTDLESVVTFR